MGLELKKNIRISKDVTKFNFSIFLSSEQKKVLIEICDFIFWLFDGIYNEKVDDNNVLTGLNNNNQKIEINLVTDKLNPYSGKLNMKDQILDFSFLKNYIYLVKDNEKSVIPIPEGDGYYYFNLQMVEAIRDNKESMIFPRECAILARNWTQEVLKRL